MMITLLVIFAVLWSHHPEFPKRGASKVTQHKQKFWEVLFLSKLIFYPHSICWSYPHICAVSPNNVFVVKMGKRQQLRRSHWQVWPMLLAAAQSHHASNRAICALAGQAPTNLTLLDVRNSHKMKKSVKSANAPSMHLGYDGVGFSYLSWLGGIDELGDFV